MLIGKIRKNQQAFSDENYKCGSGAKIKYLLQDLQLTEPAGPKSIKIRVPPIGGDRCNPCILCAIP